MATRVTMVPREYPSSFRLSARPEAHLSLPELKLRPHSRAQIVELRMVNDDTSHEWPGRTLAETVGHDRAHVSEHRRGIELDIDFRPLRIARTCLSWT